eukprot:COSAG02_NODE_7_length_64539_cov_120.393482_24_plen_105_part_00
MWLNAEPKARGWMPTSDFDQKTDQYALRLLVCLSQALSKARKPFYWTRLRQNASPGHLAPGYLAFVHGIGSSRSDRCPGVNVRLDQVVSSFSICGWMILCASQK